MKKIFGKLFGKYKKPTAVAIDTLAINENKDVLDCTGNSAFGILHKNATSILCNIAIVLLI